MQQSVWFTGFDYASTPACAAYSGRTRRDKGEALDQQKASWLCNSGGSDGGWVTRCERCICNTARSHTPAWRRHPYRPCTRRMVVLPGNEPPATLLPSKPRSGAVRTRPESDLPAVRAGLRCMGRMQWYGAPRRLLRTNRQDGNVGPCHAQASDREHDQRC